MAGIAAAALVASGSVAFAKAHKTVTLDVDGTNTSVSTFAGDVEGLLAAEGVRLDDKDEVAPNLDTALRDGSDVVVRYGRQVTVSTDGEQTDLWLNVTDSADALETLASRGTDVRLVASRSGDRAKFPLRLHDDGPVAVVADGATRVVDPNGEGVNAILERLDVELDDDDRVSVVDVEDLASNGGKAVKKAKVAKVVEKVEKAGTSDAEKAESEQGSAEPASKVEVALQVQRVETKKVTKTITLDHDSKTVQDSSRYEDLEAEVREAGEDGKRAKVFKVTTVDGVVEDRELMSNEVTKKPVTRVVAEGTKERPAPEPEPTYSGSSDSGGSGSSTSSDSTTSRSTRTAAPAVPSGSNREIGQQMAAAKGWSGSEWSCLEALWSKESGWSHTAANPSSGAYGIPQALPGSKMSSHGSDWTSNPATQIAWGLDYIAGRYGTPCGAWGHSQSVGWY